VGPIEGKDQTSKLSRNLEASSKLTAQLADRSSVGSVLSSASPSDGTGFRQAYQRRRRITSSENPAVWCRTQRQNGESGSRPPSTTFRVQSESEPLWVAMSLAISSSLANAGSGAYPRDSETRQNKGQLQRANGGRSSAPAAGARENFGLGYEASRLRGMSVLRRGHLDDRLIGSRLSTLEGQPRAAGCGQPPGKPDSIRSLARPDAKNDVAFPAHVGAENGPWSGRS